MISLSPSTCRLVARTSILVAALSLVAFGAWTAGGLFGQSPDQKKQRREEEEDAPKKPKRKITPVEVPEAPKAESNAAPKRPSQAAASGDLNYLNELAEESSHPALKTLYRSLAVPHDWAVYKRVAIPLNGEKKQKEIAIKPIPFYLDNNRIRNRKEQLPFAPLTKDWKPDKPFSVDPFLLDAVLPYEEIAQDKVRRFLGETHERLSRAQMLEAADRVLTFVLRWHDSAVQTGERSGKEWDDVGKALRKQLLEKVLLEQLELLAQAKDWDRVLELTRDLASKDGKDAQQQHIFKPIADMIRSDLNSAVGNDDSRQKARERLHKLDMEFPNNKAFEPVIKILRQQAQRFLTDAKNQAKEKNDAAARGSLEQAKRIWPRLEGLREFEAALNNDNPILRVGVRGTLPIYFSPAKACTDNELRAVEMLFESLVKLVPDDAGGFRYRQGLAALTPRVIPLGRFFQLPREAYWSNHQRLDAADVDFSLRLLQGGKGVGRSRRWGDLLASADPANDSSQLTVRLKQGLLDPLAAMTFKILPSTLPDNGDVLSDAFAKNPVTSGPFKLGPRKTDEQQRQCQVFEVNPYYSIRPTKRNVPHIQEVRFYPIDNDTDIAKMLVNGQLDLALDLTAKEVESLLTEANGDISVRLPSAAVPNRRIYFLAVNTSKLDDAVLRQALSCAIDRESLLTKHFRGALKVPPHQALNGPFPVGSWPCELDNRADKSRGNLYDPDAAVTLSKSIKNANAGPFTLKYASDNPALDKAMKELCDQVKERTGVVLEPSPCDPYKLREDVEQSQNYDVAYYHYDFPDETYWLAPLFGAPPGSDDDNKNIFNYHNVDLSRLLDGVRNNRNFAEVRKYQRLIHEHLNHSLPLVPLWQLDPLLAYRREVQPAALEPLLLFGNIEEWRMKRR